MRTWFSRLSGFVFGRRTDPDLDAEVQFHLEMLVDEHRRRGLSEGEAHAAALRAFGGVTQMKEEYREQRGLPWLETLIQDTRFGIRSLARTPGFTLAALVTLTLGIGANTAIFSVVNAVLLRPLPYTEPDRIVQFTRRFPAGGTALGHNGLHYLFLRDHLQAFDAVAAWRSLTGFNLASGDSAEYVQAMPVSKEYFAVFGATPAYGETFREEHDRTGGADVVVLGHPLWQRLFGGDPSVVGRSVLLGNRPHVIVGVLPREFVSSPEADLFVPLRPSTTGAGGGTNYAVGARLRDGVSLEKGNADAARVFAAYKAEHPSAVPPRELAPLLVEFQRSVSSDIRPALLLMLGAVGALLLIACANTANLLLARASGRGREIAVRAALGAGRSRIVRQLLTESVVLFVCGGAAGVALATWAVPVLVGLTPPGYTIHQEVSVDATVMGVMLIVSILTGVLSGLAPAASLSRHDLAEAFKDDGTRTTSSRRAGWMRSGLVVGEVALCMLLLVGAGLLIQTFINMRAIDAGFDTSRVLTARMSLQGDRYVTSAELNQFFGRALDRIRQLPGVEAAAVVNSIPIDRGLNLNVTVLDGPKEVENAVTDWRYASPDYFEAMGIRIVAGRGFDDRDRAGAPPVAVVSQQFAASFFGTVNPVGHHIRVFRNDPAMEIVGVAVDLREGGLVGDSPPVMYVPVGQANFAGVRASHTYFPMHWIVRTTRSTPELIRGIREQVRAVDPLLPFSSFRTMDEVKGAHLAEQRFQMTLLVFFAVAGLVLASAGIYGLISYSVAQRTREFGIRLALGATRQRILGAVLRRGAVLALAGVVLGGAAAIGMTRTLQAFVYGVDPLDLPTFLAVAVLLIAVAVIASLVPAIRAVRLNPVSALRE